MSNLAQSELSALQEVEADLIWDGKPNSWVRHLNARALNEVAENLVMKLYGGNPAATTDLGYTITSKDKRILVRVATQSKAGGKPFFLWRGIRPEDSFTHIAFVAVQPLDVRVFLIDKQSVPKLALRPIKGSPEAYQVNTSSINDLHWLLSHEAN